jgi:hypothetical protein
MNAPHTGQSSQLFIEATDGNAQFLSKVARSALIPQAIHIPHRVAIPLAIAQSGQSSQLVSDANDMQPVVESLRQSAQFKSPPHSQGAVVKEFTRPSAVPWMFDTIAL